MFLRVKKNLETNATYICTSRVSQMITSLTLAQSQADLFLTSPLIE